MQWKDETSYSRGDKERVPTTFAAQCGPMKLVVTSSHIHFPGRWVAHCHPLFATKPLDAATKEDAQAQAVLLAREWLSVASSALN